MQQDHVDELTAQWAAQRPELDTSLLEVNARLVRLERVLERRVGEVLAPFGLSTGEANVLAALRRASPPHELTPTELSRTLLVSSGAMTNRLDQLETRGLLRRVPDPDDGRRVRVQLTDAGLEIVDAAMDAHTAALREQLGFLSHDDRVELTSTLRRILLRLEERGGS